MAKFYDVLSGEMRECGFKLQNVRLEKGEDLEKGGPEESFYPFPPLPEHTRLKLRENFVTYAMSFVNDENQVYEKEQPK